MNPILEDMRRKCGLEPDEFTRLMEEGIRQRRKLSSRIKAKLPWWIRGEIYFSKRIYMQRRFCHIAERIFEDLKIHRWVLRLHGEWCLIWHAHEAKETPLSREIERMAR